MSLRESFTYLLRRIIKKPLFFITLLAIFASIAILLYIKPVSFQEKRIKILEIVINSEITPDKIDIDKLIEDIKNLNYDSILFVINSPGGDLNILRIVNAVKETNKTKFCYINGEATSAAYWLCSLSNYIIARPDSIIGSIGAYIIITDISGLLNKLGINVSIIKSTPYKDLGTSYRSPTEFEKEYLLNITREVTNLFIEDVISNRKIKDNISLSGLWFLAYKAKELGLIDEIGELDNMINYIANYYNVSKEKIQIIRKNYEYKKPWYSLLFNFNNFLENIYENIIKAKILI